MTNFIRCVRRCEARGLVPRGATPAGACRQASGRLLASKRAARGAESARRAPQGRVMGWSTYRLRWGAALPSPTRFGSRRLCARAFRPRLARRRRGCLGSAPAPARLPANASAPPCALFAAATATRSRWTSFGCPRARRSSCSSFRRATPAPERRRAAHLAVAARASARVFGCLTPLLPSPQSPEKVLPTGEVIVSDNPPELLLTTGEVRGDARCGEPTRSAVR